ncbi:hypothetical protein ACFE04_017709 [Oxalis oulophora]
MKPILILLTISTLIIAVQSGIATSSSISTAYEIMEAYDFPPGLLPKGIVKYDIDQTTGHFHAYLNESCSFSLEGSYKLNYKPTISGYIAKDKLTSLSGVSVKVLFLWLNIVEVIRKGDDLEFSVGIASADFGIENFYESPQCGCGLDCVTVNHRTTSRKSLVSSI